MTTRTTTLRSQDLSCPSCVAKIERALETLPGVSSAKVHFTTGRIVVEHDPDAAPETDLVKRVADTGYTARKAAF
jgi:copper chaperone CopZ